jgi:tetratricopeptide (TPR) repeat protein
MAVVSCHIPREATAERETARAIYNETLKRFFEELERAKTSDELRVARNNARLGFTKAVEQDKSYPLPYYNLGVLSEAEEDWDGAIRYFEQFRRLDSESDLSLRALQKLDTLSRLRTLASTPAAAKKRRYDQALLEANALLNLGLIKEAVSTAARAELLDDRRWEAYALIAKALADRQLFAEAIPLFQKAIGRAPDNVRARLINAEKVCEKKMTRR